MTRKFLRALLYARQSSGKEEESASIALQLELCRKYAEDRGMKVIGEYHDANTSGRLYPSGCEEMRIQDYALSEWLRTHSTEKQCRTGLGEAMERLEEADVLIVYDVTRLYRPVRHSFLANCVNQRLSRSKVRLMSIKEGPVDFTSFADTLLSSIQQQVNDNQIQITREKSRKAMARIQDSGYYPTIPKMYGVRYLGGPDRRIELIPDRVEVIRFVYDSVLARMPYARMLAELNRRFRGRCDGKSFYDSSWRHIIANPFYCGLMRSSTGELIPARQMEGKAIVSFDEWRRANEIVAGASGASGASGERARRTSLHPFSGLLYCGHCGSRLSVVEDGGKIAYACLQGVNARRDPECGRSRTNISLIRPSAEFTGLREAIRPLLLLALYKEVETQGTERRIMDRLRQREIEQTNLRKRIADLGALFASEQTRSYKAFEAAHIALTERLAKVSEEILSLKRDIDSAALAEERARLYLDRARGLLEQDVPDGEYKRLLAGAIRAIRCHEDRLEIETVYGNFTLPRYMKGKFRNLPRYTYQIVPKFEGAKVSNLNECHICVTYLYGEGRKEELIVDLSVMKIFKR